MSDSKKFLVLDDNEDIRELLEMEIEEKGHDCFLASTVDEALSLLEEKLPDIVVLDAHLQQEEGKELLEKVASKVLKNNPLYFFMTGDLEFDDDYAKSVGANGVFHKPVRFEDMILQCLDKLK